MTTSLRGRLLAILEILIGAALASAIVMVTLFEQSTAAAIPDEPTPALTVRASTAEGRPGQHTIRLATRFDATGHQNVGSDAASIGARPENGIHGTQLGPNRNGRHGAGS